MKVRVLQLGDGTHEAAKQADQAVKQDVQQDLNKKAVGNAATEDDWAIQVRNQQNTADPKNKSVEQGTGPAGVTKNNPPNI